MDLRPFCSSLATLFHVSEVEAIRFITDFPTEEALKEFISRLPTAKLAPNPYYEELEKEGTVHNWLANLFHQDREQVVEFYPEVEDAQEMYNEVKPKPNTSLTNFTFDVDYKNIPFGAFGKIYKNKTNPFVYKYINQSESTLRTIFKEMIVQVLLQSDPVKGSNVCTLHAVYRTPTHIILKLEKLETTLYDFLWKLPRSEKNQNSLKLKELLLSLFGLLDYFFKKYAFVHDDLHGNNIMIVQRGDTIQLKLIDFGKSRSLLEKHTLLESTDIQKIIGWILTTSDLKASLYFSEALIHELQMLMALPEETSNQAYQTHLQDARVEDPVVGGRKIRKTRKIRKIRKIRKTRKTRKQ